jgi:TolB protein
MNTLDNRSTGELLTAAHTSGSMRTPSPKRHHRVPVTMAAATLLLAACSTENDSDGDFAAASAVTARHVDPAAFPIVYSQVTSRSVHLFLTTPEGGEPVQFTESKANEVTPAWSPDGSRIAFVVTEDVDDGPSDIYTVHADGGDLRLLTPTDDCATDPSWSPDGQTILYLSGECGGELFAFMMDSDGDHPRKVSATPAVWPDWSPDGRIVYEAPLVPHGSDTALFVTDAEGKYPKRLDLGSLPSGSEARWSPSGDQIAYSGTSGDPDSDNPSEWNEDIFVINADGTGGRRVVDTPGNDHWPPAWSPDGRQLLYTADGAENSSTLGNLLLVDLQTLQIKPLAGTPCQCLFPDWRP